MGGRARRACVAKYTELQRLKITPLWAIRVTELYWMSG